MSSQIIKQFIREIRHAFMRGDTSLRAFGKRFIIDRVRSDEYRLTDESGSDIGLRFTVDTDGLNFDIA